MRHFCRKSILGTCLARYLQGIIEENITKRGMEQHQTGTRSGARERLRVDEPRKYRVILHNDDFTTMEFVVMMLRNVFFKTDAEAETLMMQVHREGKAVAGTYTKDIATSKVQKATRMARENGFPLRLTIEPEEK